MGFLDFLFPKTCVGCAALGNYLCSNCEKKIVYLDRQFCPNCFSPAIGGKTHSICRRTYGLDGLISLTYLGFPVNKLIHRLKYNLTTDLIDTITSAVVTKPGLFTLTNPTLLPIPLYWQRRNSRGFNQSALLGQSYAKSLNFTFNDKILFRVVNTKAQVGLKREDRKLNVHKVFNVEGTVERGMFVLFDDVWTTGATLKNAAAALKRKGAKEVWGFTLARSR